MIESLQKKIEALFAQLVASPDLKAYPHSVEVEVPFVSPLAWLAAHPHFERMYWESRDKTYNIAGLGIADCISSISRCDFKEWQDAVQSRFYSGNQSLRYFGGFRFPSSSVPSPEWEHFGYYRFVLPLFALEKRGQKVLLKCHVFLKPYYAMSDQLAFVLSQLKRISLDGRLCSGPTLNSREVTHYPSQALWEESLDKVDMLLKTEGLDKVVLARKTVLTPSSTLDPCAILQHLAEEPCFQYLFQVAPDESFVGSSPECLYTRQGRDLSTEAIAGTRPRGHTPQEELAIESEFKNSQKDKEEHAYVALMIENILKTVCTQVHSGEVDIVKLSRIQHFYQSFQGQLEPNMTDATLLETLYPTPAVAGYPVQKALQVIEEEEVFDRGWYAGLVGCVSPEYTQFAVAIRSVHLKEHTLSLFAGAGIVCGSNFSLEWAELNYKIAPYLTLFGL